MRLLQKKRKKSHKRQQKNYLMHSKMIDILLFITMGVVDDLPTILKKDTIRFYMSENYRKKLPIKLIELQDLIRNKETKSKLLKEQLNFLSYFFKSLASFESLGDFYESPVIKVWSERLVSKICEFPELSDESKNMIILCIVDKLHDLLHDSTN